MCSKEQERLEDITFLLFQLEILCIVYTPWVVMAARIAYESLYLFALLLHEIHLKTLLSCAYS